MNLNTLRSLREFGSATADLLCWLEAGTFFSRVLERSAGRPGSALTACVPVGVDTRPSGLGTARAGAGLQGKCTLPCTLDDELKTNPFLRPEDADIRKTLGALL